MTVKPSTKEKGPTGTAAPRIHPMEDLLGPFLVTHSSKTTLSDVPTLTALNNKKLVLLYFSASWCPPCQTFTPLLSNFQMQFGTKASMAVVYVSSDRSLADFTDYFAKMPWFAVPITDHEGHKRRTKLARDVFGISGLPTLVVLDAATGLFVTADARAQIQATAGQSSETIYQDLIVAKWMRGPRLTLEQAVAAPGYVWQVISFVTKTVATMASNPAYIIGAAYLFRWAMRKYFAKQGDVPVDDAAVLTTSNPIPDDEF